MDQKTPVPSVAFDPARHVIAGRKLSDGRQLFFSLSSIVEAEKAIEAAPAIVAAPVVTQDDLANIAASVLAAVKESIPPPQFPADLMATFTEMTAALVALAQRVEKLEADVKVHTENFAAIMSLGSGE